MYQPPSSRNFLLDAQFGIFLMLPLTAILKQALQYFTDQTKASASKKKENSYQFRGKSHKYMLSNRGY